MNMSNTPLDLSPLAVDRSSPNRPGNGRKSNRRKWVTRYLIPGGILTGFALLIFAAAGKSLWPRPSVEVIPVIVKRASVQQSGTPLFQAAGWIEPRPTAINVPALAPGVIEELLVVEGQSVKKGEPIARLISIDAEIAVKEAQAALAEAEGEMNRAIAEQRAAKVRLEKPVHLQVQLADAKSLLANAETKTANLPFQIETARANLKYATESVKGKRAAGNAVAGVVLQKAESELAAADSRLRELQKREPSQKREIEALQEKVAAIKSQLKLLIEETRQLGEAVAKVQSATAQRDAAKLKLQKAELELERNTVRAPIDGRILRLVTAPGMRVMGLNAIGGQNSSSVVEIYDPRRLQVRADVRLEDVPFVQRGQLVEIETASSETTIKGRVLQSNSTANIQKNTLEVKVELLDPHPTIRPEMLVTATFLAPEIVDSTKTAIQETERLFIPKQLIQPGDSGSVIWIVDAETRARKKNIAVGKSTTGNLVEITSGLQVTDKLIASDTTNLKDGKIVKVSGEERAIGR
jgi:RND family efflux transporter MFP subunit